MTADELVALVEAAIQQVTLSGTTYEAERLRKELEKAKVQLQRPYPCRTILRGLVELSKAGRHMDRYQDSEVIALWALSDKALDAPFVPDDPRDDVDLVLDVEAQDGGGLVSVDAQQLIPRVGDRVLVWRPRG